MRRRDAELDLTRLVRAFAASVVTGVMVYLLVIRLALPRFAAGLSADQLESLRAVFRTHPFAVMLALLATAAILALPVLVAFRLAYGPLTDTRPKGQ